MGFLSQVLLVPLATWMSAVAGKIQTDVVTLFDRDLTGRTADGVKYDRTVKNSQENLGGIDPIYRDLEEILTKDDHVSAFPDLDAPHLLFDIHQVGGIQGHGLERGGKVDRFVRSQRLSSSGGRHALSYQKIKCRKSKCTALNIIIFVILSNRQK